MWWKRLTRSKKVEADAQRLLRLLGNNAYDNAREAARRARGKDKDRARHFNAVALRLAELTGREIGLDTATRMSSRAAPRLAPFDDAQSPK